MRIKCSESTTSQQSALYFSFCQLGCWRLIWHWSMIWLGDYAKRSGQNHTIGVQKENWVLHQQANSAFNFQAFPWASKAKTEPKNRTTLALLSSIHPSLCHDCQCFTCTSCIMSMWLKITQKWGSSSSAATRLITAVAECVRILRVPCLPDLLAFYICTFSVTSLIVVHFRLISKHQKKITDGNMEIKCKVISLFSRFN